MCWAKFCNMGNMGGRFEVFWECSWTSYLLMKIILRIVLPFSIDYMFVQLWSNLHVWELCYESLVWLCLSTANYIQQITHKLEPQPAAGSFSFLHLLNNLYMIIQCFSLCSSFSELRVSTETAIWFYKGMYEFSVHSFLPIFDSFGFIRDEIVCSWLYLMPNFLYWNYPSHVYFWNVFLRCFISIEYLILEAIDMIWLRFNCIHFPAPWSGGKVDILFYSSFL